MLIRFSVENWMSLRDRVTFSMVATRERQHNERVPRIPKYQTNVLPVAAIYGGNASGKTNLFKALNFAKRLVVRGVQPDSSIPVELFRLDSDSMDRPARFLFELLIENMMFEFSFAVTRKTVIEEKLIEISSTSEDVLYERKNGEIKFSKKFDPKLQATQFLHFAFKGTQDNQLFLTNAVSQKVDNFKPIYDWFKEILVLVAPDDRFESFEPFLSKEASLFSIFNIKLSQLDTGIMRLDLEDIPFDSHPFLKDNDKFKVFAEERIKEGQTIGLLVPDPVFITREDGQLTAKKLVTYHLSTDGQEISFNLGQESDGSQRLIDLLPAFLEISQPGSNKVYVIDELDRSLHTLLTKRLLEAYLSGCSPESRSQLLFTTHDVLLMDQDLFRRDEMWVAERDAAGASTLYSFSEYKDVRYDKDIRKSYLQGRLGGIPRFLLNSPCADDQKSKESQHGTPE